MKRAILFLFLVYTNTISSQLFDSTFIVYDTTLYFKSNSAEIEVNDLSSLYNMAFFVNSNPNSYCNIIGFTDSKGSPEFNLELSRRRTQAVIDVLTHIGIATDRIKSNFKGEEEALKSGDNMDLPDERKVHLLIQQLIQLRRFKGKIVDDSTSVGIEAEVLLESSYYTSSTTTDSLGRFELYGPEGEFITLTYKKRNYIEKEQRLKVSALLEKHPLIAKLPALIPGRIFTFGKIYFYGSKAVVLPKSELEVMRLYRTLANADVCVELRGHVNVPNAIDIPVFSTMFILSEERAKTIYDKLAELGIAPKRMKHKGYGNWEMINPKAKTESAMQLNRRVEIKVIECEM